jgi:molecular chaperone GrpE
LVQGVEMTERSLRSALERHQVRRVSPQKGERFDHKLHQAMFEVPSAELAPGSVAEVIQDGYVLADRLLRPALVGVAKAPPDASPEQPGNRIDQSA